MNENATPSAPDEFVRVFVSYAREDRRWLDPDYRFSLIPFLMDSLRRHKVAFWFDKELKPGDEFSRLIEGEIDQSQIALLIVSQSFLNSEFIENREMPRIAERARLGKMVVVPVLVEPCDWSEYPFLADRQMVPSSPLIEYTESEPQWAKVRFQILDGLKAQLKRIREAAQSPAQNEPASATEETQAVVPPVADREPAYTPTKAAPEASDIPKPAEVHTSDATIAPTEPQQKWTQAQAPLSAVDRGKARIPRRWRTAVVGGLVLVTALVSFLLYISHEKSWKAVERGTTEDLNSIFGTNDGGRLWAVGGNGIVLESSDQGVSWTARNSKTTAVLLSVSGTSDGSRLLAVSLFGQIVESEDAGITWTARNSGTATSLCAIFGTSDGRRMWVAGSFGKILRSDDGGSTWTAYKSGVEFQLGSIFGTSDGARLWAVGTVGTVLESDDAGATWLARDSGTKQDLTSIFVAADSKRMWAVGTMGTILESDDAGATWTPRLSGVTDNLRSIFGTIDGNHLWTVGDKGTILESDDGGTSWTNNKSGVTNNLSSIFATSDGRHLWAVGDEGTILELDR
jgi:photosystem II stability/assembly factor-like uncharacterized protein